MYTATDLSLASVGLASSPAEACGVGGSLCTTVAGTEETAAGDGGSVAVEEGMEPAGASSASHGCSIIHVASALIAWAVASPAVPETSHTHFFLKAMVTDKGTI